MNFDKADTSKILKNLIEQVKKGECILFFGAGVHAPPPDDSKYKYAPEAKPLLGRELVEIMARECDFKKNFPDESVLDLQRVSLCYEITKGLGRSKLVDFLSKNVQEDKKPSPALQMLAALPFKIVITTNYDRLFEKALFKVDKDPHVFIYDPSPSGDEPTPDLTTDPTIERPLLFKMHGDLDKRDSIVITDEDYINFVQRMSEKDIVHPVPQTIRFRMQRWPTLFVGYSLRDYNLRLLFRTLRWKVDTANFPESYSIDKWPDPLILQIWQNERHFITFLTEDLWTFVPSLYKAVHDEEFPA
jgi:hypothetical protein